MSMITLHNEKIWGTYGVINTLLKMFKCVKTHDSKVRALVGSTSCERGVSEADATCTDPSGVGVHNENSDNSCTHSLTRGVCYALACADTSC